jgi:5-methyltetrahydrofolate--homocysteine methyltransferase
MSLFLNALHSGRVLLMDGAMGTELLRAGLPLGACAEEWNLTKPDRVRAIHRAYRQAGAECLLTNTFQANPLNLARHGLADQLEEIAAAALRLAREEADPGGFVLADIGPILDLPDLTEFADRTELDRVLAALAGADGFLFETCSSPRALAAVEYAYRRLEEIGTAPLLLGLAYRRSPSGELTTFSGHGPETFARHAAKHGVAALGVNCGRDIGMAEVAAILRRYRAETDLPLFARPNAGAPPNPLSPGEMAEGLEEVLLAGACLVGGCCGTTPEHIAAFGRVVTNWNAQQRIIS